MNAPYTVGEDKLPTPDCAQEDAVLMQETLVWAKETPYASGVEFFGGTYEDTEDPKRFKAMCYVGSVTRLIAEPPSFALLVEEAAVQVAECDCPTITGDDIFDDLGQTMREAELSFELDEFAGAETRDPHYEDLPLLTGTEVIIRFDRLGGYIVSGKIAGSFS